MTQDSELKALDAIHKAITQLTGYGANNTAYLLEVKEYIKELKEREVRLVEALEGLLADITEYQTINNLGGENNHWQIKARLILASIKE